MRLAMNDDPFADPRIAAEMRAVLGVRYVCLNCDWTGYHLTLNHCPQCDGAPYDRWQAHAEQVRNGK